VLIVAAWARELGRSRHTIESRLRKGWPVARALREPPGEERELALQAKRGVYDIPAWLLIAPCEGARVEAMATYIARTQTFAPRAESREAITALKASGKAA
jgi:hypothetical protein